MTGPEEFTARHEGRLRRRLVEVALGRREADALLRLPRLLCTATGLWREGVELAFHEGRIAFAGPEGSFPGRAREVVDRKSVV